MVLRLRQHLNTVETTTCYFPFEFSTTTSFDDDLYDSPDYYPFFRKLLLHWKWEMGRTFALWLLLCNSHDFTRELKAIVLILLQEQYSIVSNPIFPNQ